MERDGIVSRRQGSGTYVRNDRSGQTAVGFLGPGLIPNDIFLSVQRHIFRQSSRFHWKLLFGEALLPGESDAAGHAPVDAAKMLVESGAQGVILIPHQLHGQAEQYNKTMLNVFQRAKIPVVLLDRDIAAAPDRSPLDLVSLDNRRAGYELGRHLLDRGRCQFAFVGEPHMYTSTYWRLAGLRQALALEALSLPENQVFGSSEIHYQSIVQQIEAGKVDAVVCKSDQNAALMMREILSAGLRIPDQVSLAGFDDQPVARLLTVPLTTVAQPVQGLAIRVLSTLRDRIIFPALPPTTVRLQGELVIRAST